MAAQRLTQNKLCVCFPLTVYECRLRWFTSAGARSAPCHSPGNNLAPQGLNFGVNEKC